MNIGVWELVLVLVVVLLLFGTGKLTRAMGDLARGVRTFRDGMKDATSDAEPGAPAAHTAEPIAPEPPRALPAPSAGVAREEAAAVGRSDQPARP